MINLRSRPLIDGLPCIRSILENHHYLVLFPFSPLRHFAIRRPCLDVGRQPSMDEGMPARWSACEHLMLYPNSVEATLYLPVRPRATTCALEA